MQVHELKLARLRPAEWNANRVPPATLAKIRASIARFGIVENLVVRKTGRTFEVLSGNHRLGILRELGFDGAPCVVVDVDDEHARLLAQTLNRTRGEDDDLAYSQLLADALAELPVGAVLELLPETEATMQAALARLEDLPTVAPLDPPYPDLDSTLVGARIVSALRCPRRRLAVVLGADAGDVAYWYGRLFETVELQLPDGRARPDLIDLGDRLDLLPAIAARRGTFLLAASCAELQIEAESLTGDGWPAPGHGLWRIRCH